MKYALHWILLFVLFVCVACGEAGQTAVESVQNSIGSEPPDVVTAEPSPVPTASAEVEVLPSPDFTPTVVPTQEPTGAPTEETVKRPTAVPTRQPHPFLIVSFPEQMPVGETAVVEGVAPRVGETVAVTLHAGPHLLARVESTVDDAGSWRVELPVPHNVQGESHLIASTGGEELHELVRLLAGGSDPRGITITPVQPAPSQTAVSGTTLFLSGDVTNVINRKITVGFLANDCTEYVARQEVVLDADSTFWNAVIILPRILEGKRGCASISTGSPESDTWREILIPMEIVSLDAEEAEPVFVLGNRPDQPLKAGSTVKLFGTAVHLPGPNLQISVVSDEDPDVRAEAAVRINDFGYWETAISIPTELVGPATVRMTSSDGATVIIKEAKIVVAP